MGGDLKKQDFLRGEAVFGNEFTMTEVGGGRIGIASKGLPFRVYSKLIWPTWHAGISVLLGRRALRGHMGAPTGLEQRLSGEVRTRMIEIRRPRKLNSNAMIEPSFGCRPLQVFRCNEGHNDRLRNTEIQF